MTGQPTTAEVLAAAVTQVGGQDRPGQQAMADAVEAAIAAERHLLVQAGTGTGKSLGYLAPVLLHLTSHPEQRAVIATATLALQRQLADADIPAAVDAVEKVTGQRPRHAVLKGRTNYACVLRAREGADDQGTLLSADDLVATVAAPAFAESELGAQVLALRAWVAEQLDDDGAGDRDDAPSHTERAWAQVSIPVRECLGVQRCPYGEVCLVEKSRDVARRSDLVVTNHALLAIDAMHGGTALPDHDVLVVDEAHELVSRVTGAASAELSPQIIERVGRRVASHLPDELALDFLESADALRSALDAAPLERLEDPASPLAGVLESIRTTAREVISTLTREAGSSGRAKAGPNEAELRQAAAAVQEVFDVAERLAALLPDEVVWVADRERAGRELRAAPLTVADLLRDRVFADRTTVLTSATLKLGADFLPLASLVGLAASERDDEPPASTGGSGPSASTKDTRGNPDLEEPGPEGTDHKLIGTDTAPSTGRAKPPHSLRWRGLDVGSPFDYRRQGILYLARSLPPPTRDGLGEETLAEIAELVWAAGGRTLGLFASRRAAEAAAAHVRRELPKLTVLAQGDAQLPELTRRFVAETESCLFGTLSLWQGVDIPGDTCQLVIIDKIPFPRPDDPLKLAQQRAVAEAGGNGFLTIAAAHAALLLAQGAGRLIRRLSDRGVVAVLDPRLLTARYGSFLLSSMPPMWPTSDREVVVAALRRLSGQV